MRRRRLASAAAIVAASLGAVSVTAAKPPPDKGHGQDHKQAAGAPVADPAGVIDVPAGYGYDVLARSCVDDATSTESGATGQMPDDFDANVTVPGPRSSVWLLSAHELTQVRPGDFPGDAGKCATPEQATADDGDSDGTGSVSRLTLGHDGTTVNARELITTGLHNLCAGALTPWRTFLVNEEFPFVNDPESRSGWVWEIDPKTGAQKRATGMGRLSHEQEALYRGAWYITDDRGDYQFLYKFVPDHRRDLSTGKLFGLKFDRATNTGEWIGPLDPMAPEQDMEARVGGVADATNSFSKHEGIVRDQRGRGVVFSESASGADPGRVWLLRDGKKGPRGEVLAEGDWTRFSRPDNLRFNRRGDLLIFEDNGSSLDNDPRTGGNNQVWVLPKGKTGADALQQFATIRGGGEGTGPWFSRNSKLLYLSIQDQAQPDGSQSRVLAIRAPKTFNRIAKGQH
jgi:secreted PhoX family phosphatase